MNLDSSMSDFSEDEKQYNCSICRDFKYILRGNDAIECKCKAVGDSKNIIDKSGISEEFRKKTFQNFDKNKNIQVKEAYERAVLYAKHFHDVESYRCNSILFTGKSGAGKSHLTFAIANELMKKYVPVVYMQYRETIVKIKQNVMDEAVYSKTMSRYKNARVLIIDDLFKGGITSSDLNIMFEIINHRYFNKKSTIISTECTIEDLLNIDEAIGSRIIEMSKDFVVKFYGTNLNHRLN